MSVPNLGSNKPFHHAAAAYLEAGWHPLPLPPNQKYPPPTGFTGAQGELCDADTIASWTNKCASGANVALRLGVPLADGTMVIGFDVDNYVKGGEPKQGGRQLAELEDRLGSLPATYVLTSRYQQFISKHLGDGIDRPDIMPGIRLYRVPVGTRLISCIGPDIEVVQFHHRYAVTWPSVVDGRVYEIIGPGGMPYAGIPDPLDTPPLPVEWIEGEFVVIGAVVHEESQMKEDVLRKWIDDCLPKPLQDKELDDIDQSAHYKEKYGGAMCRKIGEAVDKFVRMITDYERSHDPMNESLWEVVQLGVEGHHGWLQAVDTITSMWYDDTLKRDKRRGGPSEVREEMARSLLGAYKKAEPKYHAGHHVNGSGETCWSIRKQRREADRYGLDMFSQLTRMPRDDRPEELGDIVGLMRLYMKLESSWTIDRSDNITYNYDRSDEDLARHLLDLYGDQIKRVHGQGKWILWSQSRWHRDSFDGHLMHAAFNRVRLCLQSYVNGPLSKQVVLALSTGDKDLIKRANRLYQISDDWQRDCGNVGRKRNALRAAESAHWRGIPARMDAKDVDSNKYSMGTAEGVVHFVNSQGKPALAALKHARKSDYVTRNTNVEWINWAQLETECPDEYAEGMQYLDTFLPDDDLKRWAQMLLGYCLIGENPERAVIFLYGQSSTGKSTMINAIEYALGEYAKVGDLSIFRPETFNSILLEAFTARVLLIDEAEGQQLSTAMIKKVAGGTTLTTQVKYKNETVSGIPDFTVVIGCNHPPELPEADDALDRRFFVIPFNIVMPKDQEESTKLVELGRRCARFFLSWMIEGRDLVVRNGNRLPEPPESARLAKQRMKSEFSRTNEFFDECCSAASTYIHRKVNDIARQHNRQEGATYKDWVEAGCEEWTVPRDDVIRTQAIWLQRETGQQTVRVSPNALTRSLAGYGVRVTQKWEDGKNVKMYCGMKITVEEPRIKVRLNK